MVKTRKNITEFPLVLHPKPLVSTKGQVEFSCPVSLC